MADRSAAAHADEQSRPGVAKRPDELVVYGGLGRAARDWLRFGAIASSLRRLEDDQTLLIQSGKPVGIFRTHTDAPRVLLANANLVPRWEHWEHFNELGHRGLMVYGSWIYRQPGHRAGHLRDLRRGRPPALRVGSVGALDPHGRPPPLAAVMAGASCLAVECRPSRIETHLATGYLDQRIGNPAVTGAESKRSMARQLEAMLAFHRMGIPVFDYGDNIRQLAKKEGIADAFAFPGIVPASIRPLVCRGVGPFRWVVLLGDPEDIDHTAQKVRELIPHDMQLHRWLDMARARIRRHAPAGWGWATSIGSV